MEQSQRGQRNPDQVIEDGPVEVAADRGDGLAAQGRAIASR